jgi:hypothetical protein
MVTKHSGESFIFDKATGPPGAGKLITELEKIRVVESNDGTRLTNPLTETQRLILETFGLKEPDLANYIAKR